MSVTTEYARLVAQVGDRVAAFAADYWDSMARHNGAAAQDMLDALLPRLRAGQLQVDALTRAYLSQIADEVGWGKPDTPTPLEELTAPRGVPPEEVYTRPVKTVNLELSRGASLPEALAAGRARLMSLVRTDMALAERASGHHTMRRYRAAGRMYRRVLTGKEDCALCIIASTQRYFVGNLMPIHPTCDCKVAPLPKGTRPGVQVIDQALLDSTHNQVAQHLFNSDTRERGRNQILGGRGKADYHKLKFTRNETTGAYEIDGKSIDHLIAIRRHGELGPTLTWRDHHFTGPSDLK